MRGTFYGDCEDVKDEGGVYVRGIKKYRMFLYERSTSPFAKRVYVAST